MIISKKKKKKKGRYDKNIIKSLRNATFLIIKKILKWQICEICNLGLGVIKSNMNWASIKKSQAQKAISHSLLSSSPPLPVMALLIAQQLKNFYRSFLV